ncbi:hypothetical protein C8R48DRAFT_776435 [Suillus tomentosus]|nr:hypothetical protein C8R48DRAFT_776435 [Suillus tomentosus]
MPVIRPPHPRRSARLKCLQPKSMDYNQGPVTRGRGKSRSTRGNDHAAQAPKLVVQWQADPSRTQRVIEYLRNHPADCRVLFFSDGKQSHTEGDHPSGKDKLSVCSVVARHVFQADPNYAAQYAEVPDKFRDSTNNHIMSLKKRFRECHDKLNSTGAGVMPNDVAQNLHAQVLHTFPWYDELLSIMGTNPALSVKTVSSHPGTDHAANFFALTQGAQTSGQAPFVPAPSGQASFGSAPSGQAPFGSAPSGQAPFGSAPSGQAPFGSAPSAPSVQAPFTVPPFASSSLPSGYHPSHPGIITRSHPPAPAPSESDTYCDNNYVGDGYDEDMDMDLRFDDVPQPQPPVTSNYWEEEGDVTILNSPPKPRASKRRARQSASPSSSCSPLPKSSSFVLPPKSQTSLHDSRAAFGKRVSRTSRTSANSPKPSSSGSSLLKTTMSAPASTSQTSQLPSSKGKGRQVKWVRSDLQGDLNRLNDEIGSVQSDRITWGELKNERYMAKYNLARQVDEHKFLREERVHCDKEAVATHQCSQEAKDTEIHLREAEAKMHAALAHAHAEEARALQLKIEYQHLMSGSNS